MKKILSLLVIILILFTFNLEVKGKEDNIAIGGEVEYWNEGLTFSGLYLKLFGNYRVSVLLNNSTSIYMTRFVNRTNITSFDNIQINGVSGSNVMSIPRLNKSTIHNYNIDFGIESVLKANMLELYARNYVSFDMPFFNGDFKTGTNYIISAGLGLTF